MYYTEATDDCTSNAYREVVEDLIAFADEWTEQPIFRERWEQDCPIVPRFVQDFIPLLEKPQGTSCGGMGLSTATARRVKVTRPGPLFNLEEP